MIEKLNADNNYIYHIDNDLNGAYTIQDRMWLNLYRSATVRRDCSTTYTVIVDTDLDKSVKTFNKGFDVIIYMQVLIREGLRGFLTGEKNLHVRSIEIADDLSNLEMLIAYVRSLPANKFGVYTRLIYNGKILTSTPKINYILSIIENFGKKDAYEHEPLFDDLPSADVGIEHEIDIIKKMFSEKELNEMLKNKEEI